VISPVASIMYVHFPPFAGLVAKQVDTTAILVRRPIWAWVGSRQSSVVSHPVGTQKEPRTRIGEVYLGISDDVLPIFEELLVGGAEVGGRRMDRVPVEYLNRADFWVGGSRYKVLDDMGCDGGCTTYRCERQRKTPERSGGRTG
jgi:hypothetical protein